MFEKIIFPRACENFNKTMPRIDVLYIDDYKLSIRKSKTENFQLDPRGG